MHSTHSDGVYTPEELATLLKSKSVKKAALTDHDTFSGCDVFRRACNQEGIETVDGIEISTIHKGRTIHILGYGFRKEDKRLNDALNFAQKQRENRSTQILEKLANLNIEIQLEHSNVIISRPEIADALVKQGYASSKDDAFEKYLSRRGKAWVDKAMMSSIDAINFIQRAGGKSVLAHPGLYGSSKNLARELAMAGLDGIEAFSSAHFGSQTNNFLDYAEEFSLMVTGGSDFHGRDDDGFLGNYGLPKEFQPQLRLKFQAL